MATEGRRTDPSLDERLFDDDGKDGQEDDGASRFDFFQAVRLLERMFPERRSVGKEGPPSAEAVRFHTHPSLSFPASAIYTLKRPQGPDQAHLFVTFMGFTGLLGTLPTHYTELVLKEQENKKNQRDKEGQERKDTPVTDFFDLFNHRFISFFYRAWAKYRFPIAYEQTLVQRTDPAGEIPYDLFTRCLFDLIGMGTDGLRGRLDAVNDKTLLYYAGLFAQHPRSASALQQLLEDYLHVSVSVEQFIGQWLSAPEETLTYLLSGEEDPSINSVLGEGAFLGDQVWDQQAKFRLRVGPIESFEQFSQFLPNGNTFHALVQLCRLFVGQEKDFEVQLVLQGAKVPKWEIGKGQQRLGWSTWLGVEKGLPYEANDAIFPGSMNFNAAESHENIDHGI